MRNAIIGAMLCSTLLVGPGYAQTLRAPVDGVLARCTMSSQAYRCVDAALDYAREGDVERLGQRLFEASQRSDEQSCLAMMEAIRSLALGAAGRQRISLLEWYAEGCDDDPSAILVSGTQPPTDDDDDEAPPSPGTPGSPGSPGTPDNPNPGTPGEPEPPRPDTPDWPDMPSWPSWDQGPDGHRR